jgi:alpha-tubulin suppressor-like RCC1 family protein
MQQVNAAIAAGTWPSPPSPHLYSWGLNSKGSLGLGNTTTYSSPKQVGTLNTWLKIACGLYTNGSVKTDGTLWMWGGNASGSLGLGNVTNYSSPKQVGALTDWSNVSIGKSDSCLAIKTDGTLWAWGANSNGQLGLGNTTNRSSPVQVGALTNWASVSSGNLGFTAAIKTDGTLWTWGRNDAGQLGLGNTTYYSSPKQVGALTAWLKVVAGYSITLAIKTNGTLWAWGKNDAGQLGLGNTTYYSSPIQVGSLTNWSSVSTGSMNSCCSFAVKTDGTMWSWGRGNNYGQLGLGNKTSYSSPKQIGALTTWLSIAGGSYFATAIKNDGTMWSWGSNGLGRLGLNNATYYSSPKQVGSLTSWTTIPPQYGYASVLAIASTA